MVVVWALALVFDFVLVSFWASVPFWVPALALVFALDLALVFASVLFSFWASIPVWALALALVFDFALDLVSFLALD